MDSRLDELLDRLANPPGSTERVTGPHRFDEIAGAVGALRDQVYAASAPHLLGPVVQEAERTLAVDDRSGHLCAWAADGSLAAALRLSDEPIELPTLSERCAELAAAHPGYSEISRVITDPRHRRLDHVTRLFAGMVRSRLLDGESTGVIGVCRWRVVRFYARFGMTAVHDDPLAIAGRPESDYFVVAATFDHMVEVGMHRLTRAEAEAAAESRPA